MLLERLFHDPAPRRIAFLLIATILFVTSPARSEPSLIGEIADGKPWDMFVVKRRTSNIIVLRPDGQGSMSDTTVTMPFTWRSSADGICLRPRQRPDETCLQLSRTTDGIAGMQGGRTIWILRR